MHFNQGYVQELKCHLKCLSVQAAFALVAVKGILTNLGGA